MSSYFFYDLETTGVNPRSSRIMQFAGQRTDMDLNPIGDPYNLLIRLPEDTLPEPDAIMITGITPQQTIADGITEAAFAEIFHSEIVKPDTIFLGFNSVRFDDEFMRFLLYRNYQYSYEWHWKNGCSRWDLLDVVRMTRALRPEGITWPFTSEGKPTNRLELLSELNKLDHEDAHDALSDVNATIAVARMIREKQPKLFDYLRDIRTKKSIMQFTSRNDTFVYSSGKYASEFEKTTVVAPLGEHPDKSGILVYDLRHDPGPFLNMSAADLAEAWKYTRDPEAIRLPVKVLRYNRCPAVAPLSVLTKENKKQLQLNDQTLESNKAKLNRDFFNKTLEALDILNAQRSEQSSLISDENNVDSQLYEKFLSDQDKKVSAHVVSCEPEKLSDLAKSFEDERMKELMPLYKARNFPKFLTSSEQEQWERFRAQRLKQQLPKFIERLQALSQANPSSEKMYLLQELQLYAESIVPESLVS